MSENKKTLVFLGAKRTAFGAFGGSLKNINLSDLGAQATKAALKDANLDPKQIDHIIYGNVLQSSVDSIYVARHVGLKSGLKTETPALGVNRLCGSGFEAIAVAQQMMKSNDIETAVVGGVENMSMTPFILRNARWGNKMGHIEAEDYLMAALVDSYCGCPMAITAENLAIKYNLSREEIDTIALRSQKLAFEAQAKGILAQEITPVEVSNKKESFVFDKDEHLKPNTTMEALSKLKPVFKKDGVVTAGNASGIVDGASSLVVSTEEFASKNNLKPMGRLVSYASCGVDPAYMGIGPVPATLTALKRAGLKLNDIDLIEINEAFCAQYLAVEKELKLNREIVNVNGGATAIGHPLAATGARLTTHLLYELKRRQKRYGLGSACIGGGQGIAVIVEAF
jgi:acetyl-CoA acetyltransferase family protein